MGDLCVMGFFVILLEWTDQTFISWKKVHVMMCVHVGIYRYSHNILNTVRIGNVKGKRKSAETYMVVGGLWLLPWNNVHRWGRELGEEARIKDKEALTLEAGKQHQERQHSDARGQCWKWAPEQVLAIFWALICSFKNEFIELNSSNSFSLWIITS